MLIIIIWSSFCRCFLIFDCFVLLSGDEEHLKHYCAFILHCRGISDHGNPPRVALLPDGRHRLDRVDTAHRPREDQVTAHVVILCPRLNRWSPTDLLQLQRKFKWPCFLLIGVKTAIFGDLCTIGTSLLPDIPADLLYDRHVMISYLPLCWCFSSTTSMPFLFDLLFPLSSNPPWQVFSLLPRSNYSHLIDKFPFKHFCTCYACMLQSSYNYCFAMENVSVITGNWP